MQHDSLKHTKAKLSPRKDGAASFTGVSVIASEASTDMDGYMGLYAVTTTEIGDGVSQSNAVRVDTAPLAASTVRCSE